MRLYTGWDCAIREWDAASGAPLRSLRGHRAHVKALIVAPPAAATATAAAAALLFSLSEDQTARAWRTLDGTCTLVFPGQGGAQLALALTADARWLVAATARCSLAVWRAEEGSLHNELEGHDGVRGVLLARETSQSILLHENGNRC